MSAAERARLADEPVVPGAAARLPSPRDVLLLLRPAEWIKNGFVLAPLVFAGQVDDFGAVGPAVATFLAFCAVSSAGYVLNDLIDAPLDRRHSVKRHRPIARGAVATPVAVAIAATLAIVGMAAAAPAGVATVLIVAGYGALTAAYTLVLKRMVIVDVMAITGGFLLRIVGGSTAIGAAPSSWILVCTGMVALFLGFTKRRQEAMGELEAGRTSRPVLEHYSLPFLDQMVAMVTAGTIMSYAIYATDSPLAGDRMLLTAPFVFYGVFRYLYLIYDRGETRSTSTLLLRDPGMLVAAVLWVITAVVVVQTA